jgi:glyoxylate/succinic semialdehyde reductase
VVYYKSPLTSPAGALSEGMALAEKVDLSLDVLLTVLGQGALASPLIAMKGPSMAAGKFDPAFPLKHQQKDMRLALELGCAAVTFYLFCCKCFW